MFNRIRIANDLKGHMRGQSDGLIFTYVTKEDTEVLKHFCEKYNKQIEIYEDYYNEAEPTDTAVEEENSAEEVRRPSINKKPKRMWVHKGKELKKILPEELNQYTNDGWKIGKK